MCAKILNLFPNECGNVYYQPGRRDNNLAIQAKGKLVDKMRNLLYMSPDKVYVRKRKLEMENLQTKKIKNPTEGITFPKSNLYLCHVCYFICRGNKCGNLA